MLHEGHDACEWLFDTRWGGVGAREVVQFPMLDDVEASMGGFVYLETGNADVRDEPGGPQHTATYECNLLLFFNRGEVLYRSLVVDGEVVYELVVENESGITNDPGGPAPRSRSPTR